MSDNLISNENSNIKKKKDELSKSSMSGKEEENDKKDYGFGISAEKLERIMGKYKERGSDFKDLKYFKEKKNINTLLKDLLTNRVNGIQSTEGREDKYGSNKVFVEPVPPFCYYVWDALGDMMVRILIVCAVVQIILGCTLSDDPSKDWIDGVSIIVAILVVVLVGSITNYQKETKFHELNDVQNKGTKYNIIRKGKPGEYISDDILVGDLIMVNYGDIIAADLLLIEGNGVKMDESALTGESDAMKKEPIEKCFELQEKGEKKLPSPLILSGTYCIEGSGKAIVLAVGDHSQKGIIRRTVDNAQENSQTPLEEKLEKIAGMIGYFGLFAGIVTLVALFIRFGVNFDKQKKDYYINSKVESIMTTFLFNFPHKRNEKQVIGNTNNDLTNPNSLVAKNILDIIILCISIIVVAIPEGLPLAVTLSLAFSIKKLMDNNNLVRKMHACETMGGANYICTDKTGTLTKNEMSVAKILTGNNEFDLNQILEKENVGNIEKQNNNETLRQIREDHNLYFKNETFWDVLRVSIAVNVECSITKFNSKDINGDTEKCETKNKTDKAFIDFLYRFKSPISVEQEKYLRSQNTYKQFPFDSKRKRMSTFVYSEDFPSKYRLFSKGGGENAALFCKYYLDQENGTIRPLDDKCIERLKESISRFNKDRLRSLYIAYKDITKEEYTNCEIPNDEGKLVDQYDMVFLGVFGIRDSLRHGVPEAVQKCHDASVNVIMVTGDNIVTATAIAKECGILGSDVDLKNLGPKEIEQDPEAINDNSRKREYINSILQTKPRAITGNSFYNVVGGLICEVCQKETNLCKCPKTEAEAKQMQKKYGDEEMKPIKKDVIKNMKNFKIVTERLNVMARSQPLHKYALVLGLRTLKNVVAVTGDGTNDAPALSKSDVGFAMFAGTDIAKEASDIVIIDNNFSSIVTAIIYGRNIYDNIRKFLQFQLSVNFCACIIVFICACIGNETPLTPIQMLWVNLIMDSLGSLALATEPPYNELLQREPTKRSESIINGRMWKHICIQSLVQIVVLLILYLIAPKFVEEGDLERLAENAIIQYCYGKLPGNGEVTKIIYGTASKWSNSDKLQSNIDKEFCGKYASRQSLNVAFKEYTDINGGTVHMTLIFNVFVIYTLFNQINCRMIDDSFNIFKRIQNSLLFPLITLVEMGLQVLIVIFGGSVFHVSSNGLTGEQWGICIGFSAITFVVSVLAKLLPLEKLIDSNKVEADEDKTVDIKIRQNEEFGSTDESFLGVRVHKKRKLYDQAIANDEKRVREDKDVLKLSENSSLNIPRVKEQ
jgi:Ca2+ transporting ATPase